MPSLIRWVDGEVVALDETGCIFIQPAAEPTLSYRRKTNREIGAILQISPSTVKGQLENIFAKRQFKNRVSAAVYAVRFLVE